MRIVYLLICFTLILSFVPKIESVHAAPKAVIAKSEYLMAEKLFNQGDHSGAIEHALKAKSLLGKSNSRIEYLLTNAYYAQGDYGKTMAALEEFFNLTPESRSGTPEYNEMVALYSEVENSRQKQSKLIESKKKEKAALLGILSTLSQQMVTVPGGCFKFGNYTLISGDDDERPPHKVCLDSFSIGKHEVTQALWSAVMGSNPSTSLGDEYPVTNVSWEDIEHFLRKLNDETGKKYRLPTEAEWIYAASSGGKKEKYSGGKDLDKLAWYDKNANKTIHIVGQKSANRLGLYDMSGNVWEWCSDWYGAEYYMTSRINNPNGPSSGTRHVLHGGSFSSIKNSVRIGNRVSEPPNTHKNIIGFRLVHP